MNTLLYQCVYGSHAHGTNTPTSDVDTRGVFLLPDNDFLGLGRPKTTMEDKATDTVFWELGHFAGLLLKGNPNIVGMLFTPDDCVSLIHDAFVPFLAMRSKFLSDRMQTAYLGWIRREMADLEALNVYDGSRPGRQVPKRLSHVPRLIWEIEGVLKRGEMVVRPAHHRRDVIVAIKTGTMDYDRALAYCRQLVASLDRLVGLVPALPPPPVDEVERLLLETRRRYGGRA